MNRRLLSMILGSLLLPLGWGCSNDPTSPTTDPFCSSQPHSAMVAVEDANLELAIRAALGVSLRSDLTCGQLGTLTSLRADNAGIVSLEGIENLTGLTNLWLRGNSITDVGPLSGLTGLTSLTLRDNSITDISPLSGLTGLTGMLQIGSNSITSVDALSGLTGLTALDAWNNSIAEINALSGLTSLTRLWLHDNSITDLSALRGLTSLTVLWLHTNPALSDVQPLLDNTGLGSGAQLNLMSTSVSCADVAALEAKGIVVISDCG